MALTNDQITAQNFKDFYGQIRPYLNGNVPTFANTFNKSDLYSTDEQLVGRWIDGRPLYQRVYDLGSMLSVSNTNWTDSGIAIPNEVDCIIYAHGFASQGRDTTNNGTFAIHCHGDNGANTFRLLAARMTSLSIRYFLVQYTKKGESQITITDGNEYSTDEQVVGRWIDGKPVYQKTITNIPITKTGWSEFSHGIANVDLLISVPQLIITTTSGWQHTWGGNGSNGFDLRGDKYEIYTTITQGTAMVTFQYTKTTD